MNFREAVNTDMARITHVRTSVRENLLTREQLAERGITEASIAAPLLLYRKVWSQSSIDKSWHFPLPIDRAAPFLRCSFYPNTRGRGSAADSSIPPLSGCG